jgi:hypothetical protein
MRSLKHPTAAGSARKHLLIKPSHYDDDGYVIRWYRSPMPANSLASVYGLIDDCAQHSYSRRRHRYRNRSQDATAEKRTDAL